MFEKSKKYPGVYTVSGKRSVSYGIDYTNPLTGLRVRKILKGATSEAKAFELRSIEIADAARGAINKAYGLKAKTSAILFDAMVDTYLKWVKGNMKSWETLEHRAKPLKRAFKGKLMSDINSFVVEKYKRARATEVKKTTVNKEISLGNQVFKKAIEWKKYHGENPFEGAGRFKIDKGKKPGSLAPEDVEAMMSEISHSVKRDMVAFAYYQGWRINEIRKLLWEDIDLDKGTAWIVDPKNGETVETVLSEESVSILQRQCKRSPHVFCHKNGKPYKTNLHGIIKNAAARAGIILPQGKAWHIFRRTWASMMARQGVDVETLRVMGNWKDSSMPLYYMDAAGSDFRRQAINRMPKLGNGRKKAEIKKVVSINDGNN